MQVIVMVLSSEKPQFCMLKCVGLLGCLSVALYKRLLMLVSDVLDNLSGSLQSLQANKKTERGIYTYIVIQSSIGVCRLDSGVLEVLHVNKSDVQSLFTCIALPFFLA